MTALYVAAALVALAGAVLLTGVVRAQRARFGPEVIDKSIRRDAARSLGNPRRLLR
jgi:hypothetical protein